MNDAPRLGEQGFIFTRNGVVQHYEGDGQWGILVAATYDDAERVVERLFAEHGHKIRVSPFGSVPGETTLEGQANAALKFGATGVWLTDGEQMQFFSPEIGDEREVDETN